MKLSEVRLNSNFGVATKLRDFFVCVARFCGEEFVNRRHPYHQLLLAPT